MNVRFAKNQMRFRFKEKELMALQKGDLLELKMMLSKQQHLQFNVKQISDIQKLQCQYHDGMFAIALPKAIVMQLLQEPSREGLEFPWMIENMDDSTGMIVQLQRDLQ